MEKSMGKDIGRIQFNMAYGFTYHSNSKVEWQDDWLTRSENGSWNKYSTNSRFDYSKFYSIASDGWVK